MRRARAFIQPSAFLSIIKATTLIMLLHGVAQALGHDYGVGFLEDDQGDDVYWGGSLVQGAATNGSLGIFIDLQGHDRLEFVADGQAFAVEADSMGIMIKRGAAEDSMVSTTNGISIVLDRNTRGRR